VEVVMSRSRLFSAVVVSVSALATMGGCQLLIGLDGGLPREGSGGSGGTSSSTSSSVSSSAASSSSSASSSSTTSSSGTGGAGGAGGGTTVTSSTSTTSASSGAGGGDAGVSCSNLTKDGSETDVDCGGAACPLCPDTKHCLKDGDCQSTYCAAGTCVQPTCTDGVKNGTETAIDCGGASCGPCPLVVLLAGGAPGPNGLLAATYDGAAWAPTTLAGTTSDAMSVAVIPSTGQAVGLLRSAGNQLQYTLWDGATWAPFASLSGDLTQGQPAIVASGATARAVYWENTTFFYRSRSFTAGAWAATAAVFPAGAAQQPCGPNPPALAPLGAEAALVFVNGSCGGATNHLYDTDLSGGAWLASKDIAVNPSYSAALRPAVVAPASGPELIVAYVQQGATQVWSSARTAGVWSAPAMIASALTSDPVALAPLPGSGAVLAYRGTNGNLYTALYAGTSWAAPVGIAGSSIAINATPAVARGIGAASAELAYTDTNGVVFHARLVNNAWTAPAQVAPGTGFSRVALGSGP
jgi:hypothetical protein